MELKRSQDIPFPYNQIFAHYKHFNAVQSSFLDVLLHSDRSVVLSAPTGSGKTVAFELAIVRMLLHQKEEQSQSLATDSAAAAVCITKAIYVAPIKALCAEKFQDWQSRFGAIGIHCVQVTGDTELEDAAITLRTAQLVVTTPEKWDSLTRRWRDFHEMLSAVRLFMIDEVHLLNEDLRGPILEVIVSRMRTIATNPKIRFIVVSATIPNVCDITAWIAGTNDDRENMEDVAQLVYTDAQRPVPLEKYVVGYNSRLRGFKFDMSLNYRLAGVLRTYSEQKATLIFCNSRKSAEMAAAALEKDVNKRFPLSDQQKAQLTQLEKNLLEIKLRKLVVHGIAFHHAGLSHSDRSQIEQNFRNGNLMLLLCTNTLAMGVNLPAHLVVVKSTETYQHGSWSEYAESTVLQMIGRAGRPHCDTKGVAVILTHNSNVRKYESLMNGKMPVESHLHKHLAEHLNSEIALHTIGSLEIAMNWIRSTYLYVRSVQNPAHYGLNENMGRDLVEKQLEELCLVQMNALESANLIVRAVQNGLTVQATNYGKLMVKFYLCLETMKLFRQIRGNETFLELFNLIVHCKEFADFALRVNEKKCLNDLNAHPLRFPIRGRIKTREDKISCLLQAVLGNITITSPGLAQESLKVLRIAERISKCLLEYMRLASAQSGEFRGTGCYQALQHSVTIVKCLHAKLWENSEFVVKQLQKIGAVYSALLVNAGKTTLKSIAETEARTIEQILNKPYPFGDEVHQNLHTFPEYDLRLSLETMSMLRICVRQVNEAHVFNGAHAVVIVGDSENNLLLFVENLDSILFEYGVFMRNIKIPSTEVEKINSHIIHTNLVGVDAHTSIILNSRLQCAKLSWPKTINKQKLQTTLHKTFTKLNKSNNGFPVSSGTAKNTSAMEQGKSTSQNLKSFTFSKRKLGANSTNTSKTTAMEAENCELKQQQELINMNDYKLKGDVLNKSAMVQTKLTEYFCENKLNNSACVEKKETENYSKNHKDECTVPTEVNDSLSPANNSIEIEEQQKCSSSSDQQSFHVSAEDGHTETNIISLRTENISRTNQCIGGTFSCLISKSLNQQALPANISNNIKEQINSLLNQPKPLDLTKHSLEVILKRKSTDNAIEMDDKYSKSSKQSKKEVYNKENITNDSSDLFRDIEANTVLDLTRNSQIKLHKIHNQPNIAKHAGLHSESSINYPSQAMTSIPNEEVLLFWYKIALSFSRLKPEAQNINNFKSIYFNFRHAHKAVDLFTTQLHNSAFSEVEEMNNSYDLNTNSSSGATNFCLRDLEEKRKAQKQKAQEKTNNTKAPPESKSKLSNPFRLQIFKDNDVIDNAPNTTNLTRSSVKSLNKEVMEMVLRMKCKDNKDRDAGSSQSVSLDSMEKQLLYNGTQNVASLTFEEYLRIFMQDNPT